MTLTANAVPNTRNGRRYATLALSGEFLEHARHACDAAGTAGCPADQGAAHGGHGQTGEKGASAHPCHQQPCAEAEHDQVFAWEIGTLRINVP